MNPSAPLIITVAPNGARKTKKDHPALPILPHELAEDAFKCMNAGAGMIHLHVRDESGAHTIDVERYRDTTAAIKERCGDKIIIQATTEAVGIYNSREQMQMVRELKPESVSLAIKELVPQGQESEAREFFQEIVLQDIIPHYILYSAEELKRFHTLIEAGVIPQKKAFLLFVLGRYSEGQNSRPDDLLPFLNILEENFLWSVCAFGSMEHAAASTAVAMGGHVRVGFENNMRLKNGEIAKDNSALVCQVVDVAHAVGRIVANAENIRSIFA